MPLAEPGLGRLLLHSPSRRWFSKIAPRLWSVRTPNEILVAACKRSEPRQEIPESISVIMAESLECKKISNMGKIGLRVTNVNLGTRADGNPNVTIRGVGSFGTRLGVVDPQIHFLLVRVRLDFNQC